MQPSTPYWQVNDRILKALGIDPIKTPVASLTIRLEPDKYPEVCIETELVPDTPETEDFIREITWYHLRPIEDDIEG